MFPSFLVGLPHHPGPLRRLGIAVERVHGIDAAVGDAAHRAVHGANALDGSRRSGAGWQGFCDLNSCFHSVCVYIYISWQRIYIYIYTLYDLIYDIWYIYIYLWVLIYIYLNDLMWIYTLCNVMYVVYKLCTWQGSDPVCFPTQRHQSWTRRSEGFKLVLHIMSEIIKVFSAK